MTKLEHQALIYVRKQITGITTGKREQPLKNP